MGWLWYKNFRRIFNSMKINKINTIGFYGDSFTFGQYLDFYDYGMTECSTNGFKTIKCKNGIHYIESHEYPLREHWLYHDSIIYGEWYKRFNSIVKRRYSTLVGNKLNVDVISSTNNGGFNKLIYEDCRLDNKSDLKIVMLSHYSRDMGEWLVLESDWGEIRKEPSIEKTLIKQYYEKVFNKFSKLNNIRFIGSWSDGERILLNHQYYRDRLIPLNGYNSIYHLRHSGTKQYSIGEDFPISDTHPSQELHYIISDSIIQYMN